jgi:Rap1a immunity proteins
MLLSAGENKMIRTLPIVFAAAVSIFLGLPAQGQDITSGNSLLGSCQITVHLTGNPNQTLSQYESWRDGYCRGIIEGVGAAAILSSQACFPAGVTNSQMLRVVFKFLQEPSGETEPERVKACL